MPEIDMRGTLPFLVAAALGLAGCQAVPNAVTGLDFTGLAFDRSFRFARIGQEIMLYPQGRGTCTRVAVDFGDGTPPLTFNNQALGFPWKVPHTYTGWPGVKTVRVKAEAGCIGEAAQDLTVSFGDDGRESMRVGFAVGVLPGTPQCQVVAIGGRPLPPIRRGTGVRIEADGSRIDYGVLLSFDAGGHRTMAAPAGYLFPSRRPWSLVYRIGTQDEQGDVGPVVFVANQTAPLEICVNDHPAHLSDNRGGALLTITVNERSAR